MKPYGDDDRFRACVSIIPEETGMALLDVRPRAVPASPMLHTYQYRQRQVT